MSEPQHPGILSVQTCTLRDASTFMEDTLAHLARIGFGHVEPYGVGSAAAVPDERRMNAQRLR